MRMHLAIAGMLMMFSALAVAQTKTYEYPRAESLPEDDTTIFPRDPALLTFQDVHLRGDRFFNAFTSKTNERERIKADLYLLGVLDATEKKLWCDYRTLKSSTIHEVVYSYFDSLPAERLKKERATTLIIEAMNQGKSSCKRKS